LSQLEIIGYVFSWPEIGPHLHLSFSSGVLIFSCLARTAWSTRWKRSFSYHSGIDL